MEAVCCKQSLKDISIILFYIFCCIVIDARQVSPGKLALLFDDKYWPDSTHIRSFYHWSCLDNLGGIYILSDFSILGAVFNKRRGAYLIRLIFLLAIFKVGGYFIVERANLMFYSTLLGRLDQFLVGMLAAQVFPLIKNYKSSTGLLVVSIFGMLSLIEVQAYFASFLSGVQKHPAWIFWPTIEAVAWSSVILCYLTWKGGLPHVIAVNLEKGAKISFSMYLWHAVIIFIFQQIPLLDMLNNHKKIYMLISLVACLSCTLFVSSVSYKTIELPFLLLRKKYTH